METINLSHKEVAAAHMKQKSTAGAEKCTYRQCIYPFMKKGKLAIEERANCGIGNL